MRKIKIPLLILGAGGHAKVLIDCLSFYDCKIIGITDPDESKQSTSFSGIPVIGGDREVMSYATGKVLLINGMGSTGNTEKRQELFNTFKKEGYSFLSIIHPAAIISSQVSMGEGVQVMAGAVVQPGCKIRDNTIINTGVTVDHGCIIGKSTHLAPGVTLSGNVKVGDNVHIGSGTTVIQGLEIGSNSTLGAGSVVLKDVPANVTVFGVPARVVQQ